MDYRTGKCSQCGAEYKVPSSFAHNVARCKVCKGVVHLSPALGARSEGGAPAGAARSDATERRRSEPKPAAPRAARPPAPEAPRSPGPTPRTPGEPREVAPAAPVASAFPGAHQRPVPETSAEEHDVTAASHSPEPPAAKPEPASKLPLGAALSAAGLVLLLLLFFFRDRLFPGAPTSPSKDGAGSAPAAAATTPSAPPAGGGATGGGAPAQNAK